MNALLLLVVLAQIVPAPKRLDVVAGTCEGTAVRCDVEEFAPTVDALLESLGRLGATRLTRTTTAGAEDVLVFERARRLAPEEYRVRPRGAGLVVSAASAEGAARASASLLQLARIDGDRVTWPAARIDDAPDAPFRCFMVDLGRNPHPPALLRRLVDALWFHKVRYLQLHLTDDQLSSWPSRAFPKLAMDRAGWTWDDHVSLEEYARARGVTVIPELDVPGHSTILRREYPEVFGESPTDLATSPEAQRGVETLLDEMLSVYASTPYVHVGGDEAYGVPGDVQRDFVNRLDAFVKSRGRRTIVWEGPSLGEGEHKISTDVLHVNWRTVDFPAQQMLDSGYEVVNAAWDPLYVVDHYPRTMFTAVEVARCYALDLTTFAHVNHDMPTFARPHRTKTAAGILGFCMPWWEGRPENLLGLCVPRLAAAGAATWNRRGESDYEEFAARRARLSPRLHALLGTATFALPTADPGTQIGNLAFGARVTPSTGGSQPVFGPARLTNGVTDRFDHFLGYPTRPDRLRIDVELREPADVARVVVHETAVGESHEVYDVLVSRDGRRFEKVGESGPGTRGERAFVEHRFSPRTVKVVRVETLGCHGLTFPSFSRLTEIQAYAD